jgi:SWI/SNF-related matrix-associated actin-dependent regulator of chromatin subfamily A3
MVENQAIARVLRLGQKRNVRVVRYVIKGTIEEVRKLCALKLQAAN